MQSGKKDIVYLPKHDMLVEDFFIELMKAFDLHNIEYRRLEENKDFWLRDFMPIQLSKDELLMYRYFPSYLKNHKYIHTVSDPEKVYLETKLEMNVNRTDLVIDGGNVLLGKDYLIMTDRVLSENPDMSEQAVRTELMRAFRVPEVIFIPVMPYDMFGHTDGLIRTVSGCKLALADLQDTKYIKKIKKILDANGFEYEMIPDNVHTNFYPISAWGVYTNYLELSNFVIVPEFNCEDDEMARIIIEELYNKPAIGVNADKVCGFGGVINCCTWNIYQ